MVMKRKIKVRKKPAIILLVVLVCFISLFIYIKGADTRKLKKIGYNKEEISFIKKNKVSIGTLKKYPYIEKLLDIVNDEDYNRENLAKYLDLYSSDKDTSVLVYMVNNNIKYEYSDKLVSLIKAKYFILKNLDRYMKYEDNDISKVITMVNSNRDSDYYTNTKEADTSKDALVLVNKYNYVPNDYVYGELVRIPNQYTNTVGSELSNVALDALKELIDDSNAEGLYIRANYSHRSYEYQEGIYNDYKKKNGEKYADSISARPGYSEHQTGLAVDVGVAYNHNTGKKFADTKEFEWMKDNSYKYGFILRYPEGKEDITGYNYEAWHYRYVGVEAATYIHDNDITFEEYYAYYVDK